MGRCRSSPCPSSSRVNPHAWTWARASRAASSASAGRTWCSRSRPSPRRSSSRRQPARTCCSSPSGRMQAVRGEIGRPVRRRGRAAAHRRHPARPAPHVLARPALAPGACVRAGTASGARSRATSAPAASASPATAPHSVDGAIEVRIQVADHEVVAEATAVRVTAERARAALRGDRARRPHAARVARARLPPPSLTALGSSRVASDGGGALYGTGLVDGERRAVHGGGRASAAARAPHPRQARPDRHARRLRHVQLRRLHACTSTARRSRAAPCSPSRPTAPRSRRSRASAPRTTCIRCRRPSGRTTGSSAATARRG